MNTDQKMEYLNLTAEIERLSKQKNEIQTNIDKMSKQTEEAYMKRREAVQGYESLKLEAVETEKKLGEMRLELQTKGSSLDAKEKEISIKSERLAEDKKTFSNERKLYSKSFEDFQSKAAELKQRELEVEKKEKELSEKLEDYTLKERHVSETLNISKTELTAEINDAKSEKVSLKQAREEMELAKEAFLNKSKDIDARIASVNKKMEEERKAFLEEKKTLQESNRKKELELVRKEKEIDNNLLVVKTMKENLEIQHAKKHKK